jgi:hypothetical protein
MYNKKMQSNNTLSKTTIMIIIVISLFDKDEDDDEFGCKVGLRLGRCVIGANVGDSLVG